MSSPQRRLAAFVLIGLGLACSDTRSVSLGELAGARRARPSNVENSAQPAAPAADTGREAAPAQVESAADIAPIRALEDAGSPASAAPEPAPREPPPVAPRPTLDAGRAPSAPPRVDDDDSWRGDEDDERDEREAEDDDDDDSNARKDADEAEEEARQAEDDDDARSDERRSTAR